MAGKRSATKRELIDAGEKGTHAKRTPVRVEAKGRKRSRRH